MLVDIRTELDFLDLDGLLLLARLVGPFLRLVLELAIVENLADRRIGIRLHLDKVETEIFSFCKSFTGIEDAQLVTFRVDTPYFRHPDGAVYARAVEDGRHVTMGTSYLTSPVFSAPTTGSQNTSDGGVPRTVGGNLYQKLPDLPSHLAIRSFAVPAAVIPQPSPRASPDPAAGSRREA